MLRYLILILVIVLHFLSPALHAQNGIGSIEGKITNVNGEPLIGINILVEGNHKGTTTNFDGIFTLNLSHLGEINLSISGIGFVTQRIKVDLKQGDRIVLNVLMQDDVQGLEEIVLVSKNDATKLRESAKAVTVLETKALKLQTSNLGEVLTTISGVNVRTGGGLGSESRFSLNGLTDDQIRFMIDGIPLDLMGYAAGIANVPVNLIERIEIYKGVVPVALGADALGGAVNLVTPKEFLNDRGSFSYQTGSFGTHRLALNGAKTLGNSGLFVRGSAYYDAAKNNYKVDVEVPDEQGRLNDVTVPRFHDAYKAKGARATLGIKDKDWADEVSLEVFGNQYEKEIQNNNVMSIVYGEIMSKEDNYGVLGRYKNKMNTKISLDASVGYTYREIQFTDISSYIYTWYGDRVKDNNGDIRESTPGELSSATDLLTADNNIYGRFILKYQLTDQQNFSFSSSPTYTDRNVDQRYIPEGQPEAPATINRTVFTWVNGLEYNWKSSNKKIENSLFVKDYIQNVQAIKKTSALPINRDRESHNFGFGNALRYKLNAQWLFKTSYEWAARLPTADEIFGNGRLIVPNLDLKPERSHNVNLEVNYSNKLSSATDWGVGMTGFLRRTEQLILLLGNDEAFSYQNVFSAVSQGIEATGFWKSENKRLGVEANVTWQDFRNQSEDGEFKNYKGDRISNRPYLFANATINYRFPKIFKSADDFNVFLGNRYVHEFYRGWESVGLKEFKDKIPSQFVQNLGFTYKLPIKKSNTALTGEIQNITNEKVYDFFGVQKPGRAFYIKLTTQF